jgi:hypothetical protein
MAMDLVREGALYKEKTGRYIDGLGYVFWKFAGEQAVTWVHWTPDLLEETKTKFLGIIHKIDKDTQEISTKSGKTKLELIEEYFPTKPGFNCKLCQYMSVCSDGQKWSSMMAAVERERTRKLPLPEDLSLGLDP